MSAVTIWIIALISYLLGAGLGFASMATAADDKDLTGVLFVTVAIIALVSLLVLVGVQIGGAA